MATTVGGVNVEIGGSTTKLEGAIGSSKAIVQRGMDSIQGAAQAVQGYLSMLGINAFAGYIKGAIDAAGKLADLAQQTGISAEVLSGLEYAAKMSGTNLDSLAGGMKKLATNMYEAGDGGKEQIKMFKDLGVEVLDANGKLKGVDAVMLELADKFAEMPEGTDKLAQSIKVFGKGVGAELIPLLNEGSAGIEKFRQRAQELGLVVSDETASAMEALGDKFDTVEMASAGAARQFAAALTPTLSSVADAFLQTTTQGGLMQGAISVLVGTVKTLTTAGYGVASAFEQVGIMLGGVAAAVANPTSAVDIFKDTLADASKAGDKWGSKMVSIWDEQVTATKKATDATDKNSKSHKGNTEERSKAIDKIKDVIKKLDDELKMLGMTAQQAEIYKQQTQAGAAANSAAGRAIADKVTQLDREKELTKLATAAKEAGLKATTDQQDALIKETGALLTKVQKAEEEYAQFGMTKSAIEREVLSRMRLHQTFIEGRIAAEGMTVARASELAAIQEQIELQEDLINVLGKTEVRDAQIKTAEEAASTWKKAADDIEKALTDALLRGFESGKSVWESVRDYVVNAAKSMVVKMAVQPIMGAITGGMGMLTGNSAMAASGTAQTASGMSNIMSTISTISTMASAFGSSIAAGFSSTIASFGATTGLAIEGGMASIAAGTSTSIAAGLGQIIGTLGPYALAAVAVYGLLGGFKGTYVKGQNLSSSYDTEGNRTSRSVRQWDNVSDGGQKFDDFLGGIANTYQQMSQALGLKSGALDLGFETNDSDGGKYGFTASVNGRGVYGVGETKITDGAIELTASRAVFAALQASEMPKYLAGVFDGLAASAMTQEQLNAAVQTAQAYQALHTTLTSLPLENLRDLSYQAASGLVAAAGGMDTLIKGLQSYYDLYYSADEKSVVSATSIAASLAAVGIDGSNLTTREDFRNLFESFDASTSIGQQQIAALLQVAPAFASLADYLTAQDKDLGELVTVAPQLALLTAATDTATTIAATAADATTSAIQSTTTAVESGTTAVVGSVKALAESADSNQEALVTQNAAAYQLMIDKLDQILMSVSDTSRTQRLVAAAPQ